MATLDFEFGGTRVLFTFGFKPLKETSLALKVAVHSLSEDLFAGSFALRILLRWFVTLAKAAVSISQSSRIMNRFWESADTCGCLSFCLLFLLSQSFDDFQLDVWVYIARIG